MIFVCSLRSEKGVPLSLTFFQLAFPGSDETSMPFARSHYTRCATEKPKAAVERSAEAIF